MAMKKVGTMTLDDLLAVRDRSPIQMGLSTIVPVLQNDLAIHNRLTADAVSKFALITTDIRRRYGTSDTIEMVKAGEFTRAHTQKGRTGSVVEFPMDGFQAAVGWTAAFLRDKTVADMAQTQLAVEKGHAIAIRRALQAAIYGSSNYVFKDYRDTQLDIGIKRFLNADGADIPEGPNGEVYNSATHTHYLFNNGWADAAGLALVRTVVEHHPDGRPVMFIAAADEATVRASTSFKAYVDVRLTPNANINQPIETLNPYKTDDKPIGLFGAAEVWLKPWAIANYAVVTDLGPQAPRPLACRVRGTPNANGQAGDSGGQGNAPTLKVAGENVMFPLQAQYMESEFGFGVWTRTNGAVLYFGAGAVAYVDPAIITS